MTLDSIKEAAIKLDLQGAFKTASSGLGKVEERIRSTFTSDAELLSEIAEYLLVLGGKRVRPTLCILSAKLFGASKISQELIDAAAGMELIHMATLLHDDIIDESPLRRNQESAYKKYGLTPTLLCGDFLLTRAYGLCANLDDFVIKETERACVELTEGELLEGIIDISKFNNTPKEEIFKKYITVVSKKTASLFWLASEIGAHLSHANEHDTKKMYEFGLNAGICFQIVDDILDITADEDLLGKPSGTDLKQKTPSLINLLWLASGDKEAYEFFSQKTIDIEQAKSVIQIVKDSGAVEEARQIANDYANKAKIALQALENQDTNEQIKKNLYSLIDYTLLRAK